jgi:hypothetical protein
MMNSHNPFPFSVPLQLASPSKRYPPVGHCIYCGTYTNKLQLEHILPFGIAGNCLLLPKASCATCASVTAKVEQACLRHLWWPLRTRMGAPTRQPKERPETFRLRRVTQVGSELRLIGDSDVNANEYPLNYVALLLDQPGILAGREPTDNLEGQIWTRYSADEMARHLQSDRDGRLMGPITPNTFARMLAKLGHSYATAEDRFRFRPLLRDLILGRTETANYWVGGELTVPPISSDPILHELSSRRCVVNGTITYLVVDIRLFAFFETPVYHVVVGEIEGSKEQIWIVE